MNNEGETNILYGLNIWERLSRAAITHHCNTKWKKENPLKDRNILEEQRRQTQRTSCRNRKFVTMMI